MSGGSQYFPSSTKARRMSAGERRIVCLLLATAERSIPASSELDSMLVSDLDDGGMGSIRFVSQHAEQGERRFGRRIAQTEFTDDDGVVVSAALNVDQHDELLELDVWKTDFSPLGKFPR